MNQGRDKFYTTHWKMFESHFWHQCMNYHDELFRNVFFFQNCFCKCLFRPCKTTVLVEINLTVLFSTTALPAKIRDVTFSDKTPLSLLADFVLFGDQGEPAFKMFWLPGSITTLKMGSTLLDHVQLCHESRQNLRPSGCFLVGSSCQSQD